MEKSFRDVCAKYIFNDDEVLGLELVGDRIISELLDLFVGAIVNLEDASKAKKKEEKLYHYYIFYSEIYSVAPILQKIDSSEESY